MVFDNHFAVMMHKELIARGAKLIRYSLTLMNIFVNIFLKQIWLHYPCWNSQVFHLNYVASKLYSTARQVNAPVITPIN